MAINPNTGLPPRHMFLCGTTGSGKSSFVRKFRGMDEFNRVLLWDPDRDHTAYHITGQVRFRNEVMRAIASGKPFRLAYSPPSCTPKEFEFFCAVLWAALDGNHLTACIIEELADVVGSGKAKGTWGELSRKSRKYGGVIFSITQRPQEIDKSILAQSAYKWCGQLATDRDRRYMGAELSLPPETLAAMPANSSTKCNYYLKFPGPEPAKLGCFNPTGPKINL